MSVLVLDRRGKPLMPCSEGRARKLLAAGRARVHRLYPFAIRVVDLRVEAVEASNGIQPMRLALDPGSRTTGLALCRIDEGRGASTADATEPTMHVSLLLELMHRGQAIRKSLQRRATLRCARHRRKTRYRAQRHDNRVHADDWLAPSLRHRIQTALTWVRRIRAMAPVTQLAQELVRFDMQALQSASDSFDGRKTIEGAEYQRGTLTGYELGEYLLVKWNHTCAYCGKTDVPLEKDHIQPRSQGGSSRVSNLVLACRQCNQRKGNQDVREFLAHDQVRLGRILTQAKAPLHDAAAVNATRSALLQSLRSTGLQVETGSGGRTKFNRERLGIPKTHALDAACVGTVGDLRRVAQPSLQVKCNGRGCRSRTRNDAFGFPRGHLLREKSVQGFRTGDMVRATVPQGGRGSKNAGTHVGRVAVRKRGSFNIQTEAGVIQGISHRYCKVLMRGDGYSYALQPQAATRKEKSRESGHAEA